MTTNSATVVNVIKKARLPLSLSVQNTFVMINLVFETGESMWSQLSFEKQLHLFEEDDKGLLSPIWRCRSIDFFFSWSQVHIPSPSVFEIAFVFLSHSYWGQVVCSVGRGWKKPRSNCCNIFAGEVAATARKHEWLMQLSSRFRIPGIFDTRFLE